MIFLPLPLLLLFVRSTNTYDASEELRLGPPENFRYLNQSGCTTVHGVHDANEFHNVKVSVLLLYGYRYRCRKRYRYRYRCRTSVHSSFTVNRNR
jgi:hypothetical protein